MSSAVELFVHAAILIPYFIAAFAGLWGMSAIARGVRGRARKRSSVRRGLCPACGAAVQGHDDATCAGCGVLLRPALSPNRWLRPVPGQTLYGVAAVAFAGGAYAFGASVPTYLFGPRVGPDFAHYRWYALAAVLSCFAAGLIGWALWSDRSRGRKRCPRCWYNMSAVPSLTCPECGHDAGSARGLARTRRRWRAVAVGLLALLGAELARRGPQIQKAGWLAAVPTTAMIAVLPWLPDGWIFRTRGSGMLDEDPTLRARVDRAGTWQWQKDWARARALALLKSDDPGRWLRAAWLRGDHSVEQPGRGTAEEDLPADFSARMIHALSSANPAVAAAASDAAVVFLDPCAAQMSRLDPDALAADLIGVIAQHGPSEPGAARLLAKLPARGPAVIDALLSTLSGPPGANQRVKEELADVFAAEAQARPDLIPRLIAAGRQSTGADKQAIVQRLCGALPDTPETIAWRRELMADPDLVVAAAAIDSLLHLPDCADEANQTVFRRAGEGVWILSHLLNNDDLRPFTPRLIELLGSRDAFTIEQATILLRETRSRHGREALDPFHEQVTALLREPRITSPRWRRMLRLIFELEESEIAPAPAPAVPSTAGSSGG